MIDDDSLIKAEISNILSSSYFKRSKRLCNLLTAIMDKTLSGNNQLIKEYTLGLEVFGLDKDYDPIKNPIVRVSVGNLRKKLNEYYNNEGRFNLIKIEIPINNYKPVIHQNISIPDRFIEEPDDTKKTSLLIVPQWNCNRDKADPFLFSLVHNLSNFRSINVSIDKLIIDTAYTDYDFKLLISNYNESEEMLFILNLVDYQTGSIIWNEKCYYNDSIHSYIRWLDNITSKISIILCSEIGIIQQYISENTGNEISLYSQAVYSFKKIYHRNYQSKALNNSMKKTKRALDVYPDNSILMSNYCSLCSIKCIIDKNISFKLLDKSDDILFRAKSIDSQNPIVLTSYLRRLFVRNNSSELLKKAQNVLNTTKLDLLSKLSVLSFLLFTSSEPEINMKKIKSLIELSPYYPNHFHIQLFLYFYRMKDYSRALEELKKSSKTDAGFYIIGLLSLLGNLNRMDEAQIILKNKKSLKPDVEMNPYRYYPTITLENGVYESIEKGLKNIT